MSTAGRMAAVATVASILSVLPVLAVTTDWTWIVPAAIAAGIVIGTGHVLRRIRVPDFIVYLAQAIALILWLGVLVASDVAWLGFIPNSAWADRLTTLVGQGFEAAETQSTPITVDDFTGVLLLLVAGAGIVAWLVDMLILGFTSPVITGAPLAACYVVTAIILEGEVGWFWFLPPAAGYLALLVTDRRARVMSWGRSATTSGRGTGVPRADSLVRTGRRVGAVAVAMSVAIPAVLPVLTEGLIGPGSFGRGGDGTGRIIETDNPILDIYDNLNRPQDVEVIRYTTTTAVPSYLRTAVVDEFDGSKWKPSQREVPESQRVSDGMPDPPGLQRDSVESIGTDDYEISVTSALTPKWLPLPYPAAEIDIEGDLRYDANTLDVVFSDDPPQGGFEYDVVQTVVEPTYEELQRSDGYPEELEPLLALPDDLSPEIEELAKRITEGAQTDIEKAQALEAFFRQTTGEGAFIYDATYDPGQSTDAIVQFLDERRGFCVQFASTMTIMARLLDIPARVGVGYVPGDRVDGSMVVLASDAHAWPELYFENIGWLRFEPTPSSREGATRPSWSFASVATPGIDGSTLDPAATSSPDVDAQLGEDPVPFGSSGGGPLNDGSAWPKIGLGVAGAAVLFSVPMGIALMRRSLRWRRAGDDPTARAEAAWSDLRDTARDAGLSWNDADTPRMIGTQLAKDAALKGDDHDLLTHIVTTTERARYSRRAVGEPSLREDSSLLRRHVGRSQPTRSRVRAYVWPAAMHDLGVGIRLWTGRLVDRIDGFREAVRVKALRQDSR